MWGKDTKTESVVLYFNIYSYCASVCVGFAHECICLGYAEASWDPEWELLDAMSHPTQVLQTEPMFLVREPII